MRIQANYIIERQDILEALRARQVVRYGGIICAAPGTPHAGELSGILRDDAHAKAVSSSWLETLGKRAESIATVVKGAVELKSAFFPEPKTADKPARESGAAPMVQSTVKAAIEGLSGGGTDPKSLLGLANIAPAAAIANLGVSIIGFAALYYQHHRMLKAVGQLEAVLKQGQEAIIGQLQSIAAVLEEVRSLAYMNSGALKDVQAALDDIKHSIEDEHLAAVESVIHLSLRDRSPENLREQWRKIVEQRIYFERQLDRITPNGDHPAVWILYGNTFRFWALAAQVEADLQRQLDRIPDAMDSLGAAHAVACESTRKWKDIALHSGGAQLDLFRYGYSRFAESVPRERVQRLLTIEQMVEPLSDRQWLQLSLRGAEQVAFMLQTPSDSWVAHQAGLAAFLDALIESRDRLGSLQRIYQFAKDAHVKWEALENLKPTVSLARQSLLFIDTAD